MKALFIRLLASNAIAVNEGNGFEVNSFPPGFYSPFSLTETLALDLDSRESLHLDLFRGASEAQGLLQTLCSLLDWEHLDPTRVL